MIIVKLMGGLGNQLFEYALYRSIKEKHINTEVYLDGNTWIDDCKRAGQTYKIQLDLYNTVVDACTNKQKDLLMNDGRTIVKKVIRKIIGDKKSHVMEKAPLKYDPRVLQLENVYLEGYWQTYKYFDDIRDILLSELKLEIPLDHTNEEVLQQIRSSNAVSVHVRRGDYLQFSEIYGGICTETYYIDAISYMRKHTNNPVFYIFSNDINWCRNTFGKYKDIVYIDINDEDHGYFDLELMRNCKHNIIANSSFSWWGAWLNENPDKIVIAPRKWINGVEDDEICPSGWVHI